MKQVSKKYRVIEAKFILRNRDTYPESSVTRAEQFLKENPIEEPVLTKVTDKEREYIKNKYPNTY